MEKSPNQDQVIQIQRTIPYSPDEVYAAFADAIRLAKWWGPKDFTNTFEIFEFKVGGSWKFIMEDPKVVAAIRHIAEPGAEQNLDRLYMHLHGELK